MTVDVAHHVGEFGMQHHLPSVAWGVIREGALAEHGVYVSESRGVTGDSAHQYDIGTRYRIASMTKSFTAATVLALRDAGVVDLDRPVSEALPRLAGIRQRVDAAPITLRLLLSMGAGMVTDDAWADRHLDMKQSEFDALWESGVIFAQPPATTFEYSNLGYALIGRVVEAVTGTTLQRHVIDRMLVPLGLDDTGWDVPDESWAAPYRLDPETTAGSAPVPELAPLADGVIAPMGGLWSTVGDIAKWMSWLDDAYPARDGADDGPLRRSSRREMQSPHCWVGLRDVNGRQTPCSYGYGLTSLHDEQLGTVIAHSGGLPGYGANMRWISGRGLGVVTMSNATYAPMTALGAQLLDLVAADAPRGPRSASEPQRQLAEALVTLLNGWANGDPAPALEPAEVLADNCLDDRPLALRVSDAGKVGSMKLVDVIALNDASFSIGAVTAQGPRTVEVTPAPMLPWRVAKYTVI